MSKSTTKQQNLDLFEKFWEIASNNDIIVKRANDTMTIDKNSMKLHGRSKNFKIWTDGSRSKEGTGYGIITSLKLLPLKSKATINTDSEISINILTNKEYKGPFLCFKEEYNQLIEINKLEITLNKVEGHADPGNIHADLLAKRGSRSTNTIQLYKLLSNFQLTFENDNHPITNIRQCIRRKYTSKWKRDLKKKYKEFENIHPITYRFMETDKITPIQKYAIWRNVHIKHMTDINDEHPICKKCNKKCTINHLMTKCPNLSETRQWAIQQICKITNNWKLAILHIKGAKYASYQFPIRRSGRILISEIENWNNSKPT